MRDDRDGGRSRGSGSEGVQSLTRALELLDALQRDETGRVEALAALHGVHKTTTLRLLQTLERFGYVTRGRNRSEFRLGLKLYELGLSVSERFTILNAARPIMRELARATGETIDLGVYDRNEILLLESITERPTGPVGAKIGQRSPATCTTTGKLYLASLPAAAVERFLEAHGFPKAGPKCIDDRDRFIAELARVRTVGYSSNDEETDVGLRFVGVPVDLPDRDPRWALILGAPTQRLPRRDFPYVADMLRTASQKIASAIA